MVREALYRTPGRAIPPPASTVAGSSRESTRRTAPSASLRKRGYRRPRSPFWMNLLSRAEQTRRPHPGRLRERPVRGAAAAPPEIVASNNPTEPA
jgi:hypothetical protein